MVELHIANVTWHSVYFLIFTIAGVYSVDINSVIKQYHYITIESSNDVVYPIIDSERVYITALLICRIFILSIGKIFFSFLCILFYTFTQSTSTQRVWRSLFHYEQSSNDSIIRWWNVHSHYCWNSRTKSSLLQYDTVHDNLAEDFSAIEADIWVLLTQIFCHDRPLLQGWLQVAQPSVLLYQYLEYGPWIWSTIVR